MTEHVDFPTHSSVSDQEAAAVAAQLTGGPEGFDSVADRLTDLVSKACGTVPDYRTPLQRLFEHVTIARALIDASQRAYSTRTEPCSRQWGEAWASQAGLFLSYAICDIADIEAIATRYEMGGPQ